MNTGWRPRPVRSVVHWIKTTSIWISILRWVNYVGQIRCCIPSSTRRFSLILAFARARALIWLSNAMQSTLHAEIGRLYSINDTLTEWSNRIALVLVHFVAGVKLRYMSCWKTFFGVEHQRYDVQSVTRDWGLMGLTFHTFSFGIHTAITCLNVQWNFAAGCLRVDEEFVPCSHFVHNCSLSRFPLERSDQFPGHVLLLIWLLLKLWKMEESVEG